MFAFLVTLYSVVFRENRGKRGTSFETVNGVHFIDMLIEFFALIYVILDALR